MTNLKLPLLFFVPDEKLVRPESAAGPDNIIDFAAAKAELLRESRKVDGLIEPMLPAAPLTGGVRPALPRRLDDLVFLILIVGIVAGLVLLIATAGTGGEVVHLPRW